MKWDFNEYWTLIDLCEQSFSEIDQWVDWWGEDLDRRGVGTSKLQMQRYADTGP